MKTDGPFYLNIPSQTLGAEGYNNSMPYAALCNVTLVSGGGGLIVITLTDDNGNEREYNLSSGNPVLIKKAYVQTIRLDGSGASVAGVLSWPDEVDPSSIAVSGPVSISGTVKTDVGQGSQIVGGTTLQYGGVAIDPRDIRPLVSTDGPGRAWVLNSKDTLGGTPVTVGGVAIDPRLIRALAATDNPDTSVNQVNNTKTDIGAAGTYAKDSSLATINTTLGAPVQNSKIPAPLSQDANGNLGIGLPTGALDPRDRNWSLGSGDTLGGTPVTVGGVAIDPRQIRALTKAGDAISTDVGLAATSEEGSGGGTNITTYNPWGFSLTSLPTVRSGGGLAQANVQRSGARGYIGAMYFMIYYDIAGAADITVNLHRGLPAGGFSSGSNDPTFVASFTFATATGVQGQRTWQTVNPNIWWPYETLVVIPQQQSFIGSGTIAVANPATFNNIDSHYWNGSFWDSSNNGFVGFWDLYVAAAPAAPVSVTAGTIEATIIGQSGSAAIKVVVAGTGAGAFYTVPVGKRATLLRGLVTIANGTAGYQGMAIYSGKVEMEMLWYVLSGGTVSFGTHPTETGAVPAGTVVTINPPALLLEGDVLQMVANGTMTWGGTIELLEEPL